MLSGHPLQPADIRSDDDRMRAPAIVLIALAALGFSGKPATGSLGSLPDPGVGIVFLADGNLWHTTKGSLGATSLLGESFNIALPGEADAGALAAADDGALWFVYDDHTLIRLAAGAAPGVFGDLPVELHDIAAGPDGNVWFAAGDERKHSGRGVIGRVTPQGDVTLFDEGVTGEPSAIAAGTDGALWFTEPKARRVGRIDAAGAVTEIAVEGRPTGLAAGSDRAMWFTDPGGSIGRVAPDGTVTRYDDAGHKPGDIALGADGQLWYALDHGIGQVRTDGTITTWALGAADPVAIAGGPDAAMYFTDARAPALGRFDITTPAGADASADGKGNGNGKGKPKPEPSPEPTPETSETFVAKPKRGEVRVRRPGEGFTDLDGTDVVPVGSVVDATQGAVTLRTETADGEQAGTFRGGRFKVRQRKSGHTDLYLRGRLDCSRADVATTARRKRKRRRVWGKDDGGDFSTHGADSVTTVRGTEWLTMDTCRGTVTRVVSGEVVVRDRATGKRHVVTAGHRYLARHRP